MSNWYKQQDSKMNDIIDELENLYRGKKHGFADSLVDYWRSRGYLSDSQRDWVLRLIDQAKAPAQEGPKLKLDRIVALLDNAAKTLKSPKISFVERGQNVVLRRLGERSKYQGAVDVSDGRLSFYGDRLWFGRIERDGSFTPNRRLAGSKEAEKAARLLKVLESDPVAAAVEYGKASGSCCFCSRQLTDPESMERGYGPICADRWGL